MNDKQTIIQPGDLVTLKGMKKINEKPIGMVKKIWSTKDVEIFWLNEKIAQRYAVRHIIKNTKLEIISKANQ